jgi:hypothetical protein
MTKKHSAIALSATAVMLGDQRVIIQPGQPLPDELSPAQRDELIASKAARTTGDEAAAAPADAPAEAPAPAEPAPAPAARKK